MKCIEERRSLKITRVSDSEAEKLVKQGYHRYISKAAFKAQENSKKEANKNAQ